MTIGIYRLRFSGTEKAYIGQSITLESRLEGHISLLKNNKHYNWKVQEAYKEFGKPTLEIICNCSIRELNECERYYIKEFNSILNGYNILEGTFDTLYGDTSPNSKYSNEEIYSVLCTLINYPEKTAKEISNITGVSIWVVQGISGLKSHVWLEEKFPIEYAKLKEARSIIRRRGCAISAKEKGIVYPTVRAPTGEVYNVEHLTNFAKEHKLQPSSLCNLLQGKANSHHGWKLASSTLSKYPPILSPEGDVYNVTNVSVFALKHNIGRSGLSKLLNKKIAVIKGWTLA